MLRGAKHILKKKTGPQKQFNNNKVSIKKTTTEIKEFGNNVTLEETHLIVKKCAEQIRLRGLNSVNIFKPTRIGDGGDEVKYLLNCLLNENIPEFDDEIKNQDLNNIVSAMKWTLRHCNRTIIPYNNYESFDRFEQEVNFDVHKGLFSNHFLNSIPNLNRDIIRELFDICIQITTTTILSSSSSSSSSSPTLTTQSDINTMNAQKIIKSLAFCLIGSSNDNEEKKKIFNNFDDAYREWIKCSNACLHLFLAYLRELSTEMELPPHLTVLLDNYVELRKKAINNPSVYFQFQHDINVDDQSADGLDSPTKSNLSRKSSLTGKRKSMVQFSIPERPISILRVTRTIPPNITSNTTFNKNNNERKSRCASILLPEMLDNLNRRTIVRTSTMMTSEEQTIAEKMWEEFQRNGIASLSDEYIKLFFSLDERYIEKLQKEEIARTPIEKNWKDFSRKGFKSFYLEPPVTPKKNKNEEKSIHQNEENNNDNNNKEVLGRNDSGIAMRPKTVAWEDFTTKGFRGSIDNISDILTLDSSVQSTILKKSSDDQNVTTGGDGKKSKSFHKKRAINLRSLKKKSTDSISSNNGVINTIVEETEDNGQEEDWEDWYVIDPAQDFTVTTHLDIQSIDRLFPYIWIETTADESTNRWGEWVFIEPRQDLLNNECEWIMIEEKEQTINIWDDTKIRGRRLRRKSNAFSTFSLPWLRPKSNNKRESKTDSKHTKYSNLPRHSESFDNSDLEGDHNHTRRKRISTKDISAPIPIDYTEEMTKRLTGHFENGMAEMPDNGYNNRLTQLSNIMPTQYETVAEYDEEYEGYAEGYGGDINGDDYTESNAYNEEYEGYEGYEGYDETANNNYSEEIYYNENVNEQDDVETENEYIREEEEYDEEQFNEVEYFHEQYSHGKEAAYEFTREGYI
ncbi:hypothetical protein C1645_748202 [Glomus cerebriforme]|uniref:Rho-GAP domain-containing protein n=1 Tax=Glomus cerebriforme TaxID=658196 RepID=A0A397TQV1_9GLOM|nr:hypothetical protein C1645_748202 [Glomus cerebriforme]